LVVAGLFEVVVAFVVFAVVVFVVVDFLAVVVFVVFVVDTFVVDNFVVRVVVRRVEEDCAAPRAMSVERRMIEYFILARYGEGTKTRNRFEL